MRKGRVQGPADEDRDRRCLCLCVCVCVDAQDACTDVLTRKWQRDVATGCIASKLYTCYSPSSHFRPGAWRQGPRPLPHASTVCHAQTVDRWKGGTAAPRARLVETRHARRQSLSIMVTRGPHSAHHLLLLALLGAPELAQLSWPHDGAGARVHARGRACSRLEAQARLFADAREVGDRGLGDEGPARAPWCSWEGAGVEGGRGCRREGGGSGGGGRGFLLEGLRAARLCSSLGSVAAGRSCAGRRRVIRKSVVDAQVCVRMQREGRLTSQRW